MPKSSFTSENSPFSVFPPGNSAEALLNYISLTLVSYLGFPLYSIAALSPGPKTCKVYSNGNVQTIIPDESSYRSLRTQLRSKGKQGTCLFAGTSMNIGGILYSYAIFLPAFYTQFRVILLSTPGPDSNDPKIEGFLSRLCNHLNAFISSPEKGTNPDISEFSQTISTLPAPFFAFRMPEGKFVESFCNAEFSALLGIKSSLKNKPVDKYLLAGTGEAITLYITKKEEKDSLKFPVKIKKRQSSDVWVEVALTKRKHNNGTVYFGTAQDISDKVAAEWQMRNVSSRISALIQNLQAGTMVEDENRHIVVVNDELCNLFHLNTIPEELIGVQSGEIEKMIVACGLNPLRLKRKLKQIVTEKSVVKGEEIELADGRFLELDYIPVFISDEYRGHLWQYHDITERRKYEENLRIAKTKAEESNLVKEEFLAHISHEIRTPLNAILGLTKILTDLKPGARELKYLNGVRVAADSLLAIINDILDFSKIRAGKSEFIKAPFWVTDVCNEVQQMLHLRAEEKALLLNVEVFDSAGKQTLGDKGRLRQILVNLVTNAIKFTAYGSVNLTVRVLPGAQKNGCVAMFTVTDTGTGIPKEKLDYIFESFSQLKNQSLANASGTGLGLPITRKLIELQGGELKVESTPGKGSVFSFSIPYETIEQAETAPLTVQEIVPLNNVSVLIAEDNELNILVVNSYMKQWGIVSEVAVNGLEAVQKCTQKKYDLILMDLSMPVMNGFEAAKSIKTGKGKNNDTPVVALSASAIFEIQKKAEENGIVRIISKPFKAEELYSVIAELTTGNLTEPGTSGTPVPLPSAGKQDLRQTVLERMRELFGGDEKEVKQFIPGFISQNDIYMAAFQGYLETNDLKALEEQVHKMRSPFGYVGLTELSSRLAEIESALKTGKPADTYLPLTEQVKKDWEIIRQGLTATS